MGGRLLKKKKKKLQVKRLGCPKCGKKESHFVPPSFGERGFFICEVK